MSPGEENTAVPKAIGPYSMAKGAGDFVFLSGQIPLDPVSGQVIQGSIEDQARRVLDNVRAVLGSQGLTLGHVVKSTMFLRDLSDFDRVNTVYAEYFPERPPARSTVEVSRLPKDVRLEIEVVAYRLVDQTAF